ncbi:MAG: hypothetical protein HRU76_03675 [Phycisphaeraceae bacterium]|nr:MAG: hypothetical protein HRU76_03675 [Phycisphaeraceae bacterium]
MTPRPSTWSCVLGGVFWIVVISSPALGQTVTRYDGGDNQAARLLKRASELYREASRAWTEEQYLDSTPERVDPAAAQRAISALEPVMSLFRQVMRGDAPEFDTTAGIADSRLSAHALVMRDVFVAVRMDLTWRLHTGATEGVAKDLQALLRFTTHPGSDGSLQGTLVGLSHLGSALELTRSGALGTGALEQVEYDALLATLDQVAKSSLTDLGGALEMERDRSIEWMTEMNLDDGSHSEMLRTIAEKRLGQGDPEIAVHLAAMTPAEIDIGIQRYAAAMSSLAEASRLSDPGLASAAFQRVIDDIAAGAYGPLATAACVRMNLMDVVARVMSDIDVTRAELQLAAAGAPGRNSLRNAAIWYRKAIALRRRIPTEVWEVIAESDQSQAAGTVRERQSVVAQAIRPVIDLLLEAADIERCEFVPPRDRARDGPWPYVDWADGMRDCAMILRVGAAEQAARGDFDLQCRFLGAALTMIAHLKQEYLLEASRVGDSILQSTAPLVEAALKADDIAAGSRAHLLRAIERLNDVDPCGYEGALRAYRGMTTGALLRQSRAIALIPRLKFLAESMGRLPYTAFAGDPARLVAEVDRLSEREVRSTLDDLDQHLEAMVSDALNLMTTEGYDEWASHFWTSLDAIVTPSEMHEWARLLGEPIVNGNRARIEALSRMQTLRAKAGLVADTGSR